MPWLPELFTAPVLQQILGRATPGRAGGRALLRRSDGRTIPTPLVESFAGAARGARPRARTDQGRGGVQGVRHRDQRVAPGSTTSQSRTSSTSSSTGSGFEEVVLHLDTGNGTVDLPVAIVADRRPDGRIDEMRVYFTSRATHRPSREPPAPAPARPGLPEPDAVAAYLRAFAAGDLDAIVAAFEPDGYARESVAGQHTHRGPVGLRAFYERLFSNGGGIPGDLRARRRRARMRPGVQPRAAGHDAAAASGRRRCLRPGVRAAGSLRSASTTTSTRPGPDA